MSLPKTGVTHYHAQLELQDKGRKINGLAVCYEVWLGSMKGTGLRTCARCVGLVPCCGQDDYLAQVPQHPIDSYRYISHTNTYFKNV